MLSKHPFWAHYLLFHLIFRKPRVDTFSPFHRLERKFSHWCRVGIWIYPIPFLSQYIASLGVNLPGHLFFWPSSLAQCDVLGSFLLWLMKFFHLNEVWLEGPASVCPAGVLGKACGHCSSERQHWHLDKHVAKNTFKGPTVLAKPSTQEVSFNWHWPRLSERCFPVSDGLAWCLCLKRKAVFAIAACQQSLLIVSSFSGPWSCTSVVP